MWVLEDWKVDVQPAGAKEAGRPGMGWCQTLKVRIRPSAPGHSCCLLQETQSVYPFCCQIEKGQGLEEEDDLDPKPRLPRPLALGRACVSV